MERIRQMSAQACVIGSGCAGLNAADTLMSLGVDCLLVTEDMNAGTSRNTGSDKQTYYKLSLAGDEGDSVGEMAGALCGPDTHGDIALCEAALSVPSFLKLCSLGVPFPVNEYGEYVGYQTDHDTRRRATSAGPLTSRMMTEALERSVKARGTRVLDRAMAVRVLADAAGVTGVDVWMRDTGEMVRISAGSVILCTGGPAHIYQDRVYPESHHGMSSLALEAGAEGANLDCWQYGLASVSFRWNVSGSYQQVIPRYVSVDSEGTEREFLADALGEKEALEMVFLKGYQWPFDPEKMQGSSRVDVLVRQENSLGRRVYMDFTRNPRGFSPEALSGEARDYLQRSGALAGTPAERLKRMNQPALELYASHGIDLVRDRLEVRVCAQHHNGGIAVDSRWQTRVPGLYAAGEEAGTFGKKRPGGSALNACQTGSRRAAEHIAAHLRPIKSTEEHWEEILLPEGEAEAFQERMSDCAAFLPEREGMRSLLEDGEKCLRQASPVSPGDPDFERRLRLKDILVTQREVLSAMLFAAEEKTPGIGVLLTRDGKSARVPARPIPERDLWFESVWKKYREERGG